MLENPKEMDTTTKLETASVTVLKSSFMRLKGLLNYGILNCNTIRKEIKSKWTISSRALMRNKSVEFVDKGNLLKNFVFSPVKVGNPVSRIFVRYATKKRTHEWYLKRKAKITPEQRAYHNLLSKQWRDRNPEKRKAISMRNHYKSRDRDRKLVYAYYGGKCECCGETDQRFFTIDHINNDGHIERKRGFYTNGSQFYRWIVKNNFPKDYRILCYNCNLGRARNGGICPHKEGSTTIAIASTAKRLEVPTTS